MGLRFLIDGERYVLEEFSDEQLARLRESLEAEMSRRDICEHGIRTGDFCAACRGEYESARRLYESRYSE